MIAVAIILVICIAWYYLTHSKSQKVWRVLARHPHAVLSMIEGSTDWVITKRSDGKPAWFKPTGGEWVGPFNLYVPDVGRIEFYGRKGVCEQQLEDLANLIQTGKLPDAKELLRRAGGEGLMN